MEVPCISPSIEYSTHGIIRYFIFPLEVLACKITDINKEIAKETCLHMEIYALGNMEISDINVFQRLLLTR